MEEDEEEAAAAEVDEEDEVAWASLGGVGCCGSGCCCGGCCWGDWATPEPRWPLPPPAPPGPPLAPPRSAMAWPGVEGAQGLRRLRPRRAAPSAVAAAGAQRDSDRPAEREPPANLHARAGLRCARSSRSPAAACCGPRGPDTGWACPKGAGSRGPTQRAPRGGASRAGPRGLWGRGYSLSVLAALLSGFGVPAPRSSSPSVGRYPASGNPGFPGRGLGPERAARERAQPLGSAEHVAEANAQRVTRCVRIG